MQKHGAMHEPITSHTSNGVSITCYYMLSELLVISMNQKLDNMITGIKTNYHPYKGLRRRGHRLKTHGTVHGAESGKNQ